MDQKGFQKEEIVKTKSNLPEQDQANRQISRMA